MTRGGGYAETGTRLSGRRGYAARSMKSVAPSECPYLAGVAVIDATPHAGMRLAGFAARTEPCNGVYLPLRGVVTALTEQATGTRMVIVSLEWLGFYERTEPLRALIATATGVPRDHIVLCATHTHCGPAVCNHVEGDCWEPTDENFLRPKLENLAAAAAAAFAAQEPVGLRHATGWCGFAHSRRRPNGRGGVEWMPTLEAPHDHTVPALFFERSDGSLKHVLFSYACHPTGGGAKVQAGGDYAGFAMLEVEKALGCTAGFLLGCAGDQKPYRPDPSHPGFPSYSVESLQELGRQLADAVTREHEFGRCECVAGALRMQSRRLTLRSTVLPRAAYEAMRHSEQPFFRRWATVNLAFLDRGERPPVELPFELQTVEFGRTLALVTMAGEMSVEYGLRLVKELGGHYGGVWPVGYANHMVGYVPSERQIPEGGYEVIGSQMFMGRSGPLESGTEERILAAVREMLAVA